MKKTFLPILLVLAFVGVCYAQFGGPMPTTNTNPQVTTTPSPNNVPQAYNNGQIDAGWLPSTVMIFPSCSGILNYSGSDIFGNCYGSSNQIPANYIANLSESQITNLITDLASKAVLPGWTSPQTGVMTGTPPSTAPAPGNPDFWFDSSNIFNLGYGLNVNGPINTPGPVSIGSTTPTTINNSGTATPVAIIGQTYLTANTLAQLTADASFAGTVYLTAPVTLTATLTLTCDFRPLQGAIITTTGYTLAINGPFEAGDYEVFAGTGTVSGLKRANPIWWGAQPTGTTDSTAALNTCFAQPDCSIPAGTYIFCSSNTALVVNNRSFIHGPSAQADLPTDYMPVRLLKAAACTQTGITVNAAGALLQGFQLDGQSGNTGDGIQVLGNSDTLRDVTVNNQGQDGIRIGNNSTGTNSNTWLLQNVQADSNTGNGIYVHDVGTNANAGTCLHCIARQNGQNGIEVGTAALDTFIGDLCESNTGSGLYVNPASAVAGFNQFYGGDYEANTGSQVLFSANASANKIVTAATVVDNGSGYGNSVSTPSPSLTWTNVSAFQNSWSSSGGSFAPVSYAKDSEGFIHLRGTVTGGTVNTVAFTLPAGYYSASYAMEIPVAGRGGGAEVAAALHIDTSGNVYIYTAGGSSFYADLDGVAFNAH